MKESLVPSGAVSIRRSVLVDYLVLTKPELTLLSVVTALGGAYLAGGNTVQYPVVLHAFLGTLLVGGGAGALNQYIERDLDAQMRRTENRPLPSGRIPQRHVLLFGTMLSVFGVLQLLLFTHFLAAFLAVVTLATYLFLYTPLKRITPFATVIGGIPGALPPLIGWTAVSGELSMGAWSLFCILFFWQMPHFLALGWMYRKDYARANYRLLVVSDPSGEASSRQILIYCIALVPAACMPTMVGMLGMLYFVGAVILSLAFLWLAIRLYIDRSNANAKRLFSASLIYLSVLVGLMIVDRVA
ncbi:MAG: heme o synthase [Ignavibacteriales bacterium]|nr:heme o synthase [Ignavibacteriales bacterium]